MTHSRLHAQSLAAFQRIAWEFARGLQPGDAVALVGPLGAGKTTFVRAIVEALHGGSSEVSSPTFTFRHRYEGTPTINHLDLYRIEHPSELTELGLEDAFASDVITLVEWPEQAPVLLPDKAVWVTITGAGNEARTVDIHLPAMRRRVGEPS